MTIPRLLVPPLAALQFLTRIPTPTLPWSAGTLPQAAAYFPAVGLLLGTLAGLLNHLLAPHLPRLAAAAFVIAFLVAITGALHEDALADAADAFGLHRPLTRTLEIMRDSRIGSFGAAALALSIVLRILLVAGLPPSRATLYLIAAHTLARWSTLPLTLLPAVIPESGQGATIAQRLSRSTLILGTAIALITTAATLRREAVVPILATCAVTALTALFYKRRIGGTTGDCFGATNQLVEIAVLTCGAWLP